MATLSSSTPSASRVPAPSVGPAVLVVLLLILVGILAGLALLFFVQGREKVLVATEYKEMVAKSAVAASQAKTYLATEREKTIDIQKKLDICSAELAKKLKATETKDCPAKASVVAKPPAPKAKKKKAAPPPVAKKPASPAVAPPAAAPIQTPPAPTPPKVVLPPSTALASAPCVSDCAPQVTQSKASKFCGLHVVNGTGYSLNLRLGHKGGWLVVSEVGKDTNTPSDSIKAKQGDMCDTLQTAVEQPHEWRGLARKFGIPDSCTRVRVGSGAV